VLKIEATGERGRRRVVMRTDQDQATLACANHPQAAASWICTDCGCHWCGACIKQVKLETKRSVAICRSCNGLCERVGATANKGSTATFGQGLFAALVYPLEGTALVLILLGTLLEAGMSVMGRVAVAGSMLVEGGMGVAMGAFLVTFLRQILLSSADGDRSTAAWPELDATSITEAALEYFATYLVCFGPWTLCRLWLHPQTTEIQLICDALLGIGALVFPMALLAVVIYDSVSALNPLLIVVSVVRTFRRYLGLCAFLGCILGIGLLLQWAVAFLGLPLLTALATGFTGVYGPILLMRALGWFYYCSKDQLAWS
jgi:hypothetical protein